MLGVLFLFRSPSLVASGLVCAVAATAMAFDGAEVYRDKCAGCHGPVGQGSDYHGRPLAGDLPVSELARVVAETMPEGDAQACVGEEAEAVAAYVHGEFYSPLAQARVRPPRRELSRLTVRQYEQSLADLIGEFRWRREPGAERGLKAHFNARKNAGDGGVSEDLVLPRAEFTLSALEQLPDKYRGEFREGDGPVTKLDVHSTLRGGLIAPASGVYEFCVKTTNATVLIVNGVRVIDAQVRSGNEPELRGDLRLVGGRVYPIELYTSRTSDDDLVVSLCWRPPGAVEEVIPSRVLSPENYPVVHATSVAFPPDDRSVGYVRGANVSAAWDEATTSAALEAAEAIIDDLPALARKPGGEARPSIDAIPRDEAIDFCRRFAEAAFRRPLTDNERRRSVERFFEPEEQTPVEGVELSLLSVLKSPQFLYPEAGLLDAPAEKRNDYATAERLALGLWDSLPDKALRERAGQGTLAEREPARQAATRMLGDSRTRSKVAEFFEHWLRLNNASQLARDPEAFPDFSPRIAADMQASLEMLIDDVVWSGDGNLQTLFLSEELYVNDRLAKFLDLPRPEGDAEVFAKAPVDTRERSGLVSHPFIVTAFSYYRDTSPIHRGVFLARHVLGRSLRPPPVAVAPTAPELAPEMTTRERVTAQTSPDACQACHVLINDLGFTLENFDAVGRFRHEEIGRPIDASGGYIATDGGTVRLSGARDLAHFLANSEDMHRSFVTQLFEHVTKQPALAYGVETRERLLRDFRANNYNIRDLLVDIAVTAALVE